MTISKADIVELKSMSNPPANVKSLMQCVGIMMGLKDLEWRSIKKDLLANLLNLIKGYDARQISPLVLKKM